MCNFQSGIINYRQTKASHRFCDKKFLPKEERTVIQVAATLKISTAEHYKRALRGVDRPWRQRPSLRTWCPADFAGNHRPQVPALFVQHGFRERQSVV